jgi:hypothetical protein
MAWLVILALEILLVREGIDPFRAKCHQDHHDPAVEHGLGHEHQREERQHRLAQLGEGVGAAAHQQPGGHVAHGHADQPGGEEAVDQHVDEELLGQVMPDQHQHDLRQRDRQHAADQRVQREAVPAMPPLSGRPAAPGCGDDGEGPAEDQRHRGQPEQVVVEPGLHLGVHLPQEHQHHGGAEEDVRQPRPQQPCARAPATAPAPGRQIQDQRGPDGEGREQGGVEGHGVALGARARKRLWVGRKSSG